MIYLVDARLRGRVKQFLMKLNLPGFLNHFRQYAGSFLQVLAQPVLEQLLAKPRHLLGATAGAVQKLLQPMRKLQTATEIGEHVFHTAEYKGAHVPGNGQVS